MKTVIKYRFFFSPRMTPLLKFYVTKRECRTLLHSVRGKVNTVKCFRLHSDQIRRCSEGRSCRRIIVCSGNSSGFWLSSSSTKIFSSLSSPLLQSDTKKKKTSVQTACDKKGTSATKSTRFDYFLNHFYTRIAVCMQVF